MNRSGDVATERCAQHRLHPLLDPGSIALVGASPRKGSLGNEAARAMLDSGFEGPVHFVNPRHRIVEGKACVGALSDLEAPPDLAVLNVGAARLEATLKSAIEAGVKSAVIFDACRGETDAGHTLVERLRDMAREADFPICGGNGMGFLNVPLGCHASFVPASHLKPGGISLIAHSGSVFTVLALNDPRFRFDLVISSGQEIGATADDYLDYAVLRPTTKVVALFIEAARNPRGLVQALEAAQAHGKPVVVCKVGRTGESASLALSHSGAMVGNDAAYDALFERYGAVVVETVDQLMNLSLVLSHDREMKHGEVAMVTDSGGLRELLIDRAHSLGVPLAQLSADTRATLEQVLPPGLLPSNPLDCAGAWSEDFANVFQNGLQTLADAPEVGALGYEVDIRDDHVYIQDLADIAHRLPLTTDKPCFFYSSFARANNRALGASLAESGVPVLNGLDETLFAIAGLRRLRDLRSLGGGDPRPQGADDETILRWRDVLGAGGWFGEARGLAMLHDFGIPAVACSACSSTREVHAAALSIGFPVVLKTTAAGVAHKSDVQGVVVNIATAETLETAYNDMASRLGGDVLVQAMAGRGVELAFGYVRDADFGPLVMVSAGGVLIEHLADRCFALAPFGAKRAQYLLSRLKLYPLLAGARGTARCDLAALADALARFSVMCAEVSDLVEELDVNPVIATPNGIQAADALISTTVDCAAQQ